MIGGYFINGYCDYYINGYYRPLVVILLWLLMTIILAINVCFINGYWWLIYYKLLLDILSY